MTCMQRAYANSPQIGVASVIYSFKFLFSTGGAGLPSLSSTSRVISFGVMEAIGGRSSRRVRRWNLLVNFSRTTLVAGQWHIMRSSSPSTVVPVAKECGHTLESARACWNA